MLTAFLEASNNWCVKIDKGLLNGVIDIDLKKAFHTIYHEIILLKQCNVNNHLSSASPLNCGAPQGSIIGPLLFVVYINDLPNCLSLDSPRMYADDTNLTFAASYMIGSDTKINNELKSTDLLLRANNLSNIAKTEFMVISARPKLQSLNDKTININVDGVQINQTNHSKISDGT